MVNVRVAARRFLAIVSLAFLAGLVGAHAQVYEGRELVKAELLADTTAIVPGKPFTVGLRLRMVPGWYTYWKFSGDAGIPTEIKWDLPPGWKVGEIQWPIPVKLDEPGDIRVYSYRDEILLMQEITPPATLSEPLVRLNAEANWLVCERLCIPGSANLQIELPVQKSASAANEDIFAKFRRMLPQAWPSAAAATWSRDARGLTLRVNSKALANYPAVEFAPLPDDKTVVGHAVTERSDDEITFRIPIESGDAKSISGLVVFGSSNDGADRNAWQLNNTPTVAAAPVALPNESRGLLTFLLFGFIGGFILNLMPCVLPVISLKIFGFIKHAGKDRRSILRNGLAFVAGIFLWFIGLAILLVILKKAGHQITWAAQFTNPYFVLGLSILVLVFALDLFGVFEINLPQAVMHRLLHSATREGEAGSFFQGLFATALATPCTAPFLGPAIGFAFTQSSAVILMMFTAVAAGMSAPYLLLSAQPAWLRFVPKPGPWMEHVKQFMGFLLLATLLFLLYVLGAQRGMEAVIWTSGFLLVISIVCWMKGAFLTPLASFATKSVTLVLMLALLIGSGVFFIGNKFAQTRPEAVAASTTGGWQNFSPEKLEAELAQGHTVFIDFTAAWCITCKFNEATVLESAAVREAFQRRGIVKLRADWTNADPVITKYLQQFGRPGVPLYVLYPAGKSPIVLPELLTKNIILEKLETIAPQVAAE